MISLLLLLLFSALALVLLDGNWRGGLLMMLLIGFLQDPIRKLTPDEPGLYVTLVLAAFIACALTLYLQRNRLELPLMLRTAPGSREWLLLFVVLIVLQAANGYARFNLLPRALIGIGFYLSPLMGLWMGFQMGRDQRFLRRFLQLYLLGSALIGITVFLDYRGMDIPLFKEVGKGILIHFRYGFHAFGSSGLWRTSELAAWHLSASACIAVVMGLSSRSNQGRGLWLLLASSFAFLVLLTGRRKGLVLVLVFLGIYLLLFSRLTTARSREQLFMSVFGAAGLAYATYSLYLITAVGDNFTEYVNRALSFRQDLFSRFQTFGVSGAFSGLDASDGIGLGAGILAQTGDLRIGSVASTGTYGNTAFLLESGFGKVIAELGIPGLCVLIPLAFFLGRGIVRNIGLLRLLPPQTSAQELGLLAFALANIPFFSAAAGVYGDPFILILCGISLGSFLAVPALVLHRQELEQLQRRAELVA